MKLRPRSLLAKIAVGLVSISLLAVLSAGLLLYLQFRGNYDRLRQRTLLGTSRNIQHMLSVGESGQLRPLTPAVISALSLNVDRFAVVDEHGAAVITSKPGVALPFPVSRRIPREYFVVREPDSGKLLYGYNRRVEVAQTPYWIQVLSGDFEMHTESLIEEFLADLAWIWIPFVVALLLVNLLIIRRALRPLRHAAALAETIGPGTSLARLPEKGLPSEVATLVRAVNLAFARLEGGYQAQRQFVADAAHELRTPLAILSSHLATIGDSDLTRDLARDVAAMGRLVEQLLDAARLDAMQIDPNDVADLDAIAADVVAFLAPLAIRQGRQLELQGSGQSVTVRGAPDFLFRALRNLIENAVNHTPPDGVVTVRVSPAPSVAVIDHGPGIALADREKIFHRFWRGRRARSGGGGAGLGLAIVERIVREHNGTIEISDTPGGGATVTIELIAASPDLSRTVSDRAAAAKAGVA